MSYLVLLSWSILKCQIQVGCVHTGLTKALSGHPSAPPTCEQHSHPPRSQGSRPEVISSCPPPNLVSSLIMSCGVCAHDPICSRGSELHHWSQHGRSSLTFDSIFPHSPVLQDCTCSYRVTPVSHTLRGSPPPPTCPSTSSRCSPRPAPSAPEDTHWSSGCGACAGAPHVSAPAPHST